MQKGGKGLIEGQKRGLVYSIQRESWCFPREYLRLVITGQRSTYVFHLSIINMKNIELPNYSSHPNPISSQNSRWKSHKASYDQSQKHQRPTNPTSPPAAHSTPRSSQLVQPFTLQDGIQSEIAKRKRAINWLQLQVVLKNTQTIQKLKNVNRRYRECVQEGESQKRELVRLEGDLRRLERSQLRRGY